MSDIERMRAAYQVHPLRESTILKRIEDDRGHLRNITELDLAIDHRTHLTDQNHVGELDAVVRIARLVRIDESTSVLDVGSGLGGPARALSYLYGCEVLGVEVTESRYQEATHLTQLTRLDHRVQFLRANFLDADLQGRRFDVIIILDSFGHFSDKPQLTKKSLAVCNPGGVIVVQDVVLARTPSTDFERLQIERLTELWNVKLITSSAWRETRWTGAKIEIDSDLTLELKEHLGDCLAPNTKMPTGTVPKSEIAAWELATWAIDVGLIAYYRQVVRKAG